MRKVTLLLLAKNFRKSRQASITYLESTLIRKAALIVNNLSGPSRVGNQGAAGEPAKCPVASDYGGRRSCRSPCPRAAQPGRLAPGHPEPGVPREPARTGSRPLGRLPFLAATADTQRAAGCTLPPLPPLQIRRRTGHSRLPGGATHPSPTPRLPPAAGLCGRAVGEPTGNPRKSGGGGRGPSSRAKQLLVLDGPRAAVLSNAISVPFKGPRCATLREKGIKGSERAGPREGRGKGERKLAVKGAGEVQRALSRASRDRDAPFFRRPF